LIAAIGMYCARTMLGGDWVSVHQYFTHLLFGHAEQACRVHHVTN
jgi:hypothetical protein